MYSYKNDMLYINLSMNANNEDVYIEDTITKNHHCNENTLLLLNISSIINENPTVTIKEICDSLNTTVNIVTEAMRYVTCNAMKDPSASWEMQQKERKEKTAQYIFMRDKRREFHKQIAMKFMRKSGSALLIMLQSQNPLTTTEIKDKIGDPMKKWETVRNEMIDLDTALNILEYKQCLQRKNIKEDIENNVKADVIWTLISK